jgi:hypothetical protein
MPPEGRKIRVSTQATITRVYEIDVDTLLADPYFEAVNLHSEEALADHFDDWLEDKGDNWSAPWARELVGLNEGEREVYEVELHPDKDSAAALSPGDQDA